jgi:Family of unknown function (DUF6533)
MLNRLCHHKVPRHLTCTCTHQPYRRLRLRDYCESISGGVWNYCQISGISTYIRHRGEGGSSFGTAILFYDYILTLPREISLVWRWPWQRCDFRPSISMSSLLYVLMRHTLLVSYAVTLILSLHPNLGRVRANFPARIC